MNTPNAPRTIIKEGPNTYLVRLVRVGERYGLNDVLINDRKPLVEFYLLASEDMTAEQLADIHGPRGFFIGRWQLSSLTHDWLTSEPRATQEGLLLSSARTSGGERRYVSGENLTHALISILTATL